MSCDISSPDITEAYNDVRDDRTETNWMAITWAEGSKDKVWCLAGKGTDGIEGFKAILSDTFIGYGYLRVNTGDELSVRPKFVLVKSVGKKNKMTRKAALNVQRGDVERVLNQTNIFIEIDSPDDLTEEDINQRLIQAGGQR